ncbi:MAG: 4-phosphopantetheinyl transferase [Candidatus Binatota bacterium]|nr:4-phosphopantetheinyl transferase [Candidatus Binatota bacterium]
MLGPGEVHLWRAPLDLGPAGVRRLEGVLAPEERARAERFRFAIDRDRYVAARGQLRTILAAYLRRHPERLRFEQGAQGKPALAAEDERAGLRFNLAHSDAVAVFAVTRVGAVGVDVELVRADLPFDEMAERFLPPRDCDAIRGLLGTTRAEAFAACWTRKEAYLKASGVGLAGADERSGPFETDSFTPSDWCLQRIDPQPGYVGALAVEGHGWTVRPWQWTEASFIE